MSHYQTEQKKVLLSFLEQNTHTPYRIDDIVRKLREEYGSETPGKSTIYRLMTELVEEGRVKRLVRGNSRHFVYQLLSGTSCHRHLHLKCNCCGNLLHLDAATSNRILQAVESFNQFSVSLEDTVLFGTCRLCAERTGGQA